MGRADFRLPRLFVAGPLAPGLDVALGREQGNYLLNVLRLKPGSPLLVFDGASGEFRATIAEAGRRGCRLSVGDRTRPQPTPPDLHYLFAPLKHARLDYLVQKTVEMGAGVLRPVLTRHTQVTRVNLERMRANVIEAAEQCGVLAVPRVEEPVALERVLAGWPAAEPGRRLLFCDEGETSQNPLAALAGLEPGLTAVLVGPEGGFSEEERHHLRSLPFVTPLPLGPRILRADTAAVAALAVVQAALGDWR